MARKLKQSVGVWAAAVAVGAAHLLGRAQAEGIPTEEGVLTYSGKLTDEAGNPLAGARLIQVQLWDQPSGGTAPVCATASVPRELRAGRFIVDLSEPGCVAAVHDFANLYMEIVLDGVSFGRNKIGAVPYAVEADTATKAASAVGSLATRLDALERGLQELNAQRDLVQLDRVPVDQSSELWTVDATRTDNYRYLDTRVTFPRPFAMVPKVALSLAEIEVANEDNTRFFFEARDVTETGFVLHFATWSTTEIYSFVVGWSAFP